MLGVVCLSAQFPAFEGSICAQRPRADIETARCLLRNSSLCLDHIDRVGQSRCRQLRHVHIRRETHEFGHIAKRNVQAERDIQI